jgi:carboxymethylenebutenolidase
VEEAAYISPQIKALISYGGKKFTTLNELASTSSLPPQLIHVPGPHKPRRESFSIIPASQTSKPFEGTIKTYQYEDARELSAWVLPSDEDYHKRSAGIAHTRSLTFLKPLLNGPFFDLEAVWEEHTKFEFGERDVEKTMQTMVDAPYVNHIPTMTYVIFFFLTRLVHRETDVCKAEASERNASQNSTRTTSSSPIHPTPRSRSSRAQSASIA